MNQTLRTRTNASSNCPSQIWEKSQIRLSWPVWPRKTKDALYHRDYSLIIRICNFLVLTGYQLMRLFTSLFCHLNHVNSVYSRNSNRSQINWKIHDKWWRGIIVITWLLKLPHWTLMWGQLQHFSTLPKVAHKCLAYYNMYSIHVVTVWIDTWGIMYWNSVFWGSLRKWKKNEKVEQLSPLSPMQHSTPSIKIPEQPTLAADKLVSHSLLPQM